MFERLKRLYRSISATIDGPDSSRPQRVNPDPPKDEWFSRVRARSLRASAAAEARQLELRDGDDPELGRDASRRVDELFARATGTSARR